MKSIFTSLLIIIFVFVACKKNDKESTVIDVDRNVYNTIVIGTQVWMKENLRTTSFNDGTLIPWVAENKAWSELSSPGFCFYNNDRTTFSNTYGALYNWSAINSRKLCPSGWHVPSDAEWTTLTTYLGGVVIAGGKLKESSVTFWNYPNVAATNESGFTALPGGWRMTNGEFWNVGYAGVWWSATQRTTSSAWGLIIYSNYSEAFSSTYNNHWGLSVRCIKN
jgi:uncharacterized protein (TIGR02145 family)